MTAKELQELTKDETHIRQWLQKINETDKDVIYETITAMRLDHDYRKWILNYAHC
jgi:deoxyribodipyrimidine photolyase